MTTTSAGNGPSAGDGRSENDEGWGWFTPAQPATEAAEAAASRENEQYEQYQHRQHEQQQYGQQQYGQGGQAGAPSAQPQAGAPRGAADGGDGTGTRPLSPIATGPGAGRALWAETPEEAAIPVPAPPDPGANGPRSGNSPYTGAPGTGTPPTGTPPDGTPSAPDSARTPDSPRTADDPGAAPGHGPRGAPAPGGWSGGGPEAPREHPAPSPYGHGGPEANAAPPTGAPGQAQAQPQAQPKPQAPAANDPEAPPRPGPPPAHPPRPSAAAPPPPAAPPRPGPPPPAERPAPPQVAAHDGGSAAEAQPAADVESRDAALIRRTLDEVEPRADAATSYFYALLFVRQPALRELFPASMDTQRDRLFRALLTAVRLSDEPDALSEYLAGLGRGHRKYGTLPEHYPVVGECLLGALAQYAPDTWGQDAEDAWVRAYTTISQAMIDAAADDAQRAPAWWNAQIVSHELRTSEIAVITLRPDNPYPFLAGQYTSVETPWWPRVWRHYSLASSPRSDGLLTLHVKAVPGGWVSSALVNRARPGDVLRLGPPAGSMTVDHKTDSGLLCVGGGTGIAPIRALVEDVAQHGRSRPVEVFYGARTDHDLYDLETMMRMEKQHGWLSVRPVVATPPGSAFANALPGQLPDAVRQYGPWSAYTGYLSGPPGMIRSGVDALVASGVPANRIRHDSLAELIAGGERTPE
ncbi:globin domain-containing protein [Streptomyces winkii]|uniref:globin domain-containing protein n=1 Tax=Streptomyces winkii TaxID=3051178 RepID=UPI0028D592F8|nr:globin domain-containing protein [Streptomyces sp. DSM 40971]